MHLTSPVVSAASTIESLLPSTPKSSPPSTTEVQFVPAELHKSSVPELQLSPVTEMQGSSVPMLQQSIVPHVEPKWQQSLIPVLQQSLVSRAPLAHLSVSQMAQPFHLPDSQLSAITTEALPDRLQLAFFTSWHQLLQSTVFKEPKSEPELQDSSRVLAPICLRFGGSCLQVMCSLS
ncbi:hypothetical protein PAMP_019142 [Pampus punctatissimus]